MFKIVCVSLFALLWTAGVDAKKHHKKPGQTSISVINQYGQPLDVRISGSGAGGCDNLPLQPGQTDNGSCKCLKGTQNYKFCVYQATPAPATPPAAGQTPTTPGQPATPAQPTQPAQPVTPSKPATSQQPPASSPPAQPAPPVQTQNPAQPSQPVVPGQSTQNPPMQPVQPGQGQQNGQQNPAIQPQHHGAGGHAHAHPGSIVMPPNQNPPGQNMPPGGVSNEQPPMIPGQSPPIIAPPGSTQTGNNGNMPPQPQPQAYLRTETVRVLASQDCDVRENFTLLCSDLQNLGSCDNKSYTCTVSADKMCSCTSR